MLATANGLKESLGEYWTDGLVILWLKPRSGTRRFNQRPPSTSVREIISSNGGFNLRFYIPKMNNTFDQIASANTVSMDAGLSQFAFAKASSTLFKKVFSK